MINDTYGHLQGDLVLKEMGALLSNTMREFFDVAGRYGGEEFLLVFDETDQDQALTIVERIRIAIENHGFTRTDKTGKPIDGEFLTITLSFGIAENTKTSGIKNATEWISRADSALYFSKENGRNRATVWNSSL
jgi:diguanylate cyclase (GGDEF)-like protein